MSFLKFVRPTYNVEFGNLMFYIAEFGNMMVDIVEFGNVEVDETR
jgi:hypothetical protein